MHMFRINLLKIIILLSVIFSTVVFLQYNSVFAANECGGVDTVVLNCSKVDGKSVDGTWAIVLTTINIFTAGVGVAAVGGLIYAGIIYSTASNDQSKIAKAKETIFNVVLGIVMYALMYAFLQYIIPGGIFGNGKVPLARSSKSGTGSEPDPTKPKSKASPDICYTVTSESGINLQGKMFHKEDRQSYAFENSPQGLRYAAAHNYTSIDLDTQVTKDGVVVNTHWGRPMEKDGFYDPLGKLNKNLSVGEMTLDQITRLKNRDGQSKIYPLSYMIKLAGINDINLSIEIKTPRTFEENIPDIIDALNRNNVKATMKGYISFSGMNQTLTTVRKHGVWTRGVEGSQEWRAPEKCKG